MVVFALTTKMDLVKYSFYIFVGIIALLIATLLNVFVFQSSEFDWLLTIAGIVLFSISTARGVQKIVRMDQTLDPALRSRLAIIGAMILFTDFVNLFIRILQIVGSKKK